MKTRYFLSMMIFIKLSSCSIPISNRMEGTIITPGESHDGVYISTLPDLTFSATPSPTMSITKALLSTPTDTPTPGNQNISLNTLPLGRYLAYTKIQKGEGSPLYIISETGQKIGDIALGGGDYTISYNQKYIAYNHSGEVEIFNIEQEETFNLQITEPCFFGAVELTWNDRGDELAFPCGTEIFVISVPESRIIGNISHMIDSAIPGQHFRIKRSPNGKWITYFVNYGPEHGTKGPFITDMSCMDIDEGCERYTKSVESTLDNDNALLEWTPENNLVVMDPRGNNLCIYNVNTLSLIQEINLPESIHWVSSISWSPNGEWIAIGSDEGISILSIESGEVRNISIESNKVKFWFVVS